MPARSATDNLEIPTGSTKSATVSDKKLKMAMVLVAGMSEVWKPEQYRDTYREDVIALVDRKVKAKETKTITMPGKEATRPRSGNMVDLVALLQQSIGKKPGKGSVAAAAPDEDKKDNEDNDREPPRKARKPAAAMNEKDDAPAAKPRKVAVRSTEHTGEHTAARRGAAGPKNSAAPPKAAAKLHAAPRRKAQA